MFWCVLIVIASGRSPSRLSSPQDCKVVIMGSRRRIAQRRRRRKLLNKIIGRKANSEPVVMHFIQPSILTDLLTVAITNIKQTC